MTTIREDRLEHAIMNELQGLQLTQKSVARLRAQWQSGSIIDDLSKQRRALAAQIEDRQFKMSRLADLLIAQSIDLQTYDEKKRELGFELSQLQGQLDDLPEPQIIRQERESYISSMTKLVAAYERANHSEKRQQLRNTFTTRRADQTKVRLVVRSWVGIHCDVKKESNREKSAA